MDSFGSSRQIPWVLRHFVLRDSFLGKFPPVWSKIDANELISLLFLIDFKLHRLSSNSTLESPQPSSSDGIYMPESNEKFMRRAIQLAIESVANKGGPFGAVVVREGVIVGEGSNCVTQKFDPTAHAEVQAIRAACQQIQDFRLQGCELYTSCEPCPMCLAATYWSRIDRLFFSATRADAANAGFDDKYFYDQVNIPIEERDLPMITMLREAGATAFNAWNKKSDRVEY